MKKNIKNVVMAIALIATLTTIGNFLMVSGTRPPGGCILPITQSK